MKIERINGKYHTKQGDKTVEYSKSFKRPEVISHAIRDVYGGKNKPNKRSKAKQRALDSFDSNQQQKNLKNK